MLKNFFRVEPKCWLIVLPIIHGTIPWVAYRLRNLIPAAMMVLWLLMVCERLMVQKRSFATIPFFAGVVWTLILWALPTVYSFFGCGLPTRYDQWAMVLNQMTFFTMSYYMFSGRKFYEIRFITVITLVCFIIAGLLAIRGLGMDGFEGARAMTGLKDTATDDQLYGAYQARVVGLGNYGYMYMCSWMVAPLVWAMVSCRNLVLRILFGAALVGCILCIKGGGLGTPVAIAALSALLVGLWFVWRWRKIVATAGFFFCFSYFLYATTPTVFSFLETPLRKISENMQEGSIRTRVESVADAVSGSPDSYARSRAELQFKSFDAFKRFPIFGVFASARSPYLAQKELGGHSYMLDRLGGYGLIGSIPWFFFLICMGSYFKALSRMCLSRNWLVVPTIFLIMFVFSSIVNPTTGIPIQFYYTLPGLAVLVRWRELNSCNQFVQMPRGYKPVW